MPGLRLKVGAGAYTDNVIKDGVANSLVTVDIIGGSWAAYQSPVTWTLVGPSTATPPTLSDVGGGGEFAEQEFTPVAAGRYVVIAMATPSGGGDPVRLGCIYEVGSAAISDSEGNPGAGVPTPLEENEYDSTQGWARAAEYYLRNVKKGMGGRKIVTVYNDSIGALTKYQIVGAKNFTRYSTARSGGDSATDYLEDVALYVGSINATDIEITNYRLLMMLEDTGVGERGYALMEGLVPFDTQAWSADETVIYVNNAGELDNDPGTYARECGTVIVANQDDDITGTLGVIDFKGNPNSNQVFPDFITLADNQGSATNVGAPFIWPEDEIHAVSLDYSVRRGTTANAEVGTMYITLDGVAQVGSITTQGDSTATGPGMTFSIAFSAGNFSLQYTSTSMGTAPTFQWRNIKTWEV